MVKIHPGIDCIWAPETKAELDFAHLFPVSPLKTEGVRRDVLRRKSYRNVALCVL